MSKIILKNITKKFGHVTAAENVNLKIRDKEFLILLGPSGCGKTTLLRIISGLETPTEGEVYIDDKLVNDVTPQKRDVGMVFQSYALYPHMTAYDNIATPLKIRKIPKEQIRKRVREIAELMKVEELLDRKPAKLSGGQRQRIALGRALVRNPKVFLMDEPLSNLDAKLRMHMRVEIKKMQKKLGITTIYVTHDQSEAMAMADKIAILNYGRIQQVGTPDEVYATPNNVFVGNFIGTPSMNLIDCNLEEDNGKIYLKSGSFRFKLDEELANTIIEKISSSELIIGIRPHDISLNRHKQAKKLSLMGIIDAIEPLGDEVIVTVMANGNALKITEGPNFNISSGEKIWLTFKKDAIHLFDKKNGKVIVSQNGEPDMT